ncbi:unnamed protein product [Gadus morhua 'NCC']
MEVFIPADGFPGLETAPVSSAADVESAWTGRREEEEHEAELKRTQAKRPLWRRFGGEILYASHSCSMNHTIPRGHLEVQTPEDTWRSTPRAHLEDHRPEAEPNP